MSKSEWSSLVTNRLNEVWHRKLYAKLCTMPEFTLSILFANDIINSNPKSLYKNNIFNDIAIFLKYYNIKYEACHFHPQFFSLILAAHPWYWTEKNKCSNSNVKISDYPICVIGCGMSVTDQMMHILCECSKFKLHVINVSMIKTPMPENEWIHKQQQLSFKMKLDRFDINNNIKKEVENAMKHFELKTNEINNWQSRRSIHGFIINDELSINWLQLNRLIWELEFVCNVNINIKMSETRHLRLNISTKINKLKRIKSILNVKYARIGAANRRSKVQMSVNCDRYKRILSKCNNNDIFGYTDGACTGNPGLCGAGCVVLFSKDTNDIFDSKCAIGCGTNNIGELYAIWLLLEVVILNIECVKNKVIRIFTDSEYVCNVFAYGAIVNANNKLVTWILKELNEFHESGFKLFFYWIGGHSEITFNERADKNACSARDTAEEWMQLCDKYYETMVNIDQRPLNVVSIKNACLNN